MLRRLSASRLSTTSENKSTECESPTATKVAKCADALRKVAKTTRNAAASHSNLSSTLIDWSESEDNSALKDINRQTAELMLIWSDVQLDFAERIEGIAQSLRKINDAEKRLADKRRHLNGLIDCERKLSHNIKTAGERPYPISLKKGGDIRLLKQQLDELNLSRMTAERELSDGKAEEQVVKMFRYRQTMQSLSDAYSTVAQQCQTVFAAQRELCELVPAVATQDVRSMTYDGAALSAARVQQVRHELLRPRHDDSLRRDNSRRRSAPAGFLAACRQSFRFGQAATVGNRRQAHSTDEQPSQQQYSPPPSYNLAISGSPCRRCAGGLLPASPLYPPLAQPTAPPMSPPLINQPMTP